MSDKNNQKTNLFTDKDNEESKKEILILDPHQAANFLFELSLGTQKDDVRKLEPMDCEALSLKSRENSRILAAQMKREFLEKQKDLKPSLTTLSEFQEYFVFEEFEDSLTIKKVKDCLKDAYLNIYLKIPRMLNDKLICLPNNCSSLFTHCIGLKSLDLTDIIENTDITDISYMFKECQSLENLKFGNINTSRVTNMSGIFEDCYALKVVDLDNFDTSKVTDMSGMFKHCWHLKSVNLDNFNTSNVINMSEMFAFTSSLEDINLSSFDTSNVKNMHAMFHDLRVSRIDLSNFNTLNVLDMSEMFRNSSLEVLDLSSFNTSNVVNMESMFWSCSKLVDLNISSFNFSTDVNTSGMFLGCKEEITPNWYKESERLRLQKEFGLD